MSRFDYVKYDTKSTTKQNVIKEKVVDLEKYINALLTSPRSKALALTKLEETYTWACKAIRDDQISENEYPKQSGAV